MGILLTIIYALWFAWILYRWSLPAKLGIAPNEVIFIFGIKILSGLFYGWLHLYHYFGDTWAFFRYGKVLTNVIETSKIDFLRLTLLPLPDPVPDRWYAISESIRYWSEIPGYTMVRISAWLNLFSFGHYEVHVVFWEFASLIGLILLFAVFQHFIDKSPLIHKRTNIEKSPWKNVKKTWWLIILLPGFLFWFSGIHKEGLSIFALGLLLYGLTFWKKEKILILGIVIGAALLLLVRPYLISLLLPALLVFFMSKNLKGKPTSFTHKYPLLSYGAAYFAAFVFARLAGLVSPKLDILQRMVKIRDYFTIYYNGNSDVPLSPLEPTLLSFLANFPSAIRNVVFRPFLTDVHNFLSFLAFIETYFFVAFWGFLLWTVRKQSFSYYQKQIFFLCFFFGLANVIMIGLTVDNLGAIVRYRSIAYLFMTVGFCGLVIEKK